MKESTEEFPDNFLDDSLKKLGRDFPKEFLVEIHDTYWSNFWRSFRRNPRKILWGNQEFPEEPWWSNTILQHFVSAPLVVLIRNTGKILVELHSGRILEDVSRGTFEKKIKESMEKFFKKYSTEIQERISGGTIRQ